MSPTTVLSFGDSWAYLGFDQFKDAFAVHGINATVKAGTPAAYWAFVQPDALVKAIDDAGADAVVLSVGGNEFLEGLPLGHDVEALFEEMMGATKAILDRLWKRRPVSCDPHAARDGLHTHQVACTIDHLGPVSAGTTAAACAARL